MRRKLYLLFLALVPVLTYGQGYEPFLKEGKTWQYRYQNMSGKQYMQSLVVRGDTTINDLDYKKIYDVASDAYQFALREDGKKVYCKFQNMNAPKLLYDFGKNEGEVVSEEAGPLGENERLVVRVVSVDTVKSGERLLRRMGLVEELWVDNEFFGPGSKETWIEGLGSSCYLTTPIREPGNFYNFHSCWIGDDVLGVDELFWANETVTSIKDSHKAIHSRSASPDLPLYDLQGRRINIKPQKGVYIQNGKKIVLPK